MDKITKSLQESIKASKLDKLDDTLGELYQDYSEVGLDLFISDEILKELPIIKTLIAVPKIWQGISNYLLANKVLKFLFQLKDIPIEVREKFIKELEGEKKGKIIGQLMLILDKHDQYKKSKLQGKLFKALILNKIDDQEYFSLTYAVSLMNIEHLDKLIAFYITIPEGTSPQMSTELLYNFGFLQLIKIDNSQIGLIGGGGPNYKRCDLGNKFVSIITK